VELRRDERAAVRGKIREGTRWRGLETGRLSSGWLNFAQKAQELSPGGEKDEGPASPKKEQGERLSRQPGAGSKTARKRKSKTKGRARAISSKGGVAA